MTDQPHILVIDDDRRLRELLRKYLADQNFLVSTAESAADADAKLASLTYDLLIVDVMMPGEDGMSLTHRIRKTVGTPVLMLTAMGETDDRIAGLESGADDYLSKPFEPRELVLRIHSILRRSETPKPAGGEIDFGPFRFDADRMELWRGEHVVPLTGREASLLRVFALQPDVTLTRFKLSQQSGANERTIDVQVTRLRRKIEEDPRTPRYLQTVWGEGYVLRTN